MHVAKRQVRVVLALGIDVRYAPGVVVDRHRCRQPLQLEFAAALGLCGVDKPRYKQGAQCHEQGNKEDDFQRAIQTGVHNGPCAAEKRPGIMRSAVVYVNRDTRVCEGVITRWHEESLWYWAAEAQGDMRT